MVLGNVLAHDGKETDLSKPELEATANVLVLAGSESSVA